MSKRIGAGVRRGVTATLTMVMLATALVASGTAQVQGERPVMLQVEVSDSLGLPLPDAKLETFTLMDGGVFWEWIPVAPEQLPEGINLLRFSNPGYRSAVLSAPLRKGTRVSLRVRPGAEDLIALVDDLRDARLEAVLTYR